MNGNERDAPPSSLLNSRWVYECQTAELFRARGTLLALKIRKGRGAWWSSGIRLGRGTSYSLTQTCIKLTNKLVSSHSGAPLVLGQATGNSRLIWLTTARIQGKPPPSPIYILCATPWGPHPNGCLSQDSQLGVLKLQQLGFPRFWGCIASCADLRLQWGLKQSCSPHWELSNDILHVACTQGNRPNF
jgi:hypothetical protein